MKITIDHTEGPAALRLTAGILLALAQQQDGHTVAPVAAPAPAPAPAPAAAAGDPDAAAAAAAFAGNKPADPPPPPPVIPAAPAAPTLAAAPAPGAEVDSTGLPWDGVLHSEAKTKNKDGSWREKRNLDPVMRQRRIAELRGQSAFPTADPVIPPANSSIKVDSGPPAPPVNAPAQPTADQADAFKNLMSRIVSLTTAKKISKDQVDAACAQVGLKTLTDLIKAPEHVATVAAFIDSVAAP